jgi:hypothetical protein
MNIKKKIKDNLNADHILPYSKGRLHKIVRYLMDSKATYNLEILAFGGKVMPACDIFLTEEEFLNNLQYHFKAYDFVPDIDLLRRLEKLGFMPFGGLLSREASLSPIPKHIDTLPGVVKLRDVARLYRRYDDVLKCTKNKTRLYDGSIELAGLAPSSISLEFISKNESQYPTRLYLFSQIRELDKFFFLTASRFLQGVSYYEKKIAEFETLVQAGNTLEPQLQKFLEENYWMWGFEYTEAIPKKQLGEKYEIDFLLRRIDGIWEIVEIERSSLRLFTNKLDPRKELTHATQQVRDYQSFCMRNYNYLSAEDNKDIFAPKGFVIIGHELSLSEKRKLDELNKSHPLVEIHTYQYLINRARHFVKTLKSVGKEIRV